MKCLCVYVSLCTCTHAFTCMCLWLMKCSQRINIELYLIFSHENTQLKRPCIKCQGTQTYSGILIGNMGFNFVCLCCAAGYQAQIFTFHPFDHYLYHLSFECWRQACLTSGERQGTPRAGRLSVLGPTCTPCSYLARPLFHVIAS